jgi:hypothetical protein
MSSLLPSGGVQCEKNNLAQRLLGKIPKSAILLSERVRESKKLDQPSFLGKFWLFSCKEPHLGPFYVLKRA